MTKYVFKRKRAIMYSTQKPAQQKPRLGKICCEEHSLECKVETKP